MSYVSRQTNTMADKKNILYMFDRPSEPSFTNKGDDQVSFDVPPEFFVSLTILFCTSINNLSQSRHNTSAHLKILHTNIDKTKNLFSC